MMASTRFPLGFWTPTSSVRVVNVVKKTTQPLGLSLCWNYNSVVECTQSKIHVKENMIQNVTFQRSTPLLQTALRLLSIFSQITHKGDYYICLTTHSLTVCSNYCFLSVSCVITTVSWFYGLNLLTSVHRLRLLQTPLLITELLSWLLCRRIPHLCFRVTSLTNVSSTITTGRAAKEPLLSLANQSLSDITYTTSVKF